MAGSPFTPNPFQAKFLALWLSGRDDPTRPSYSAIGAMAGWGSGKTHNIPLVMQLEAELDATVDGFYVTDTFGRGQRTVTDKIRKVLVAQGWELVGGTVAPHWRSPRIKGVRSKVWVLNWKRPKGASKSANSIEGPDCGWGLLDEANTFTDGEVADAMWGRVRSGPHPKIGLVGKPDYGGWWLRWATEHNGIAFRASSYANRHNLKGFDVWVASMTEKQRRENVFCDPQPPDGAVLSDWSTSPWPRGNLAPEGWRPPDGAITRVAMDFGIRHPVLLAITHDPELDADVVWLDVAPDDATTVDVCRLALRDLWPAAYGRRDGRVPLHRGSGDKAGGNRNTMGTSDFAEVQKRPEEGGLGISLRRTTIGERVDVIEGLKVLQRRVLDPHTGKRHLLCCPRLWRAGLDAPHRSLAKSVLGYRWSAGARGDVVLKDGIHDHHIDALRYDAINWHWPQADIDRGLFTEAPRNPSLEAWQVVETRER